MDLKEAIYTRRSIREFTAEPVDEKTIRDLIDAAIKGLARSMPSLAHFASYATKRSSLPFPGKPRRTC